LVVVGLLSIVTPSDLMLAVVIVPAPVIAVSPVVYAKLKSRQKMRRI
jgi:hypothetical protein